jgi:hypothetical protein
MSREGWLGMRLDVMIMVVSWSPKMDGGKSRCSSISRKRKRFTTVARSEKTADVLNMKPFSLMLTSRTLFSAPEWTCVYELLGPQEDKKCKKSPMVYNFFFDDDKSTKFSSEQGPTAIHTAPLQELEIAE